MLFSVALTAVTLLLSISETLASPFRIYKRACPTVELIHAAGTTESGLGIVGTPISQGLEAAVPGCVTDQRYPGIYLI